MQVVIRTMRKKRRARPSFKEGNKYAGKGGFKLEFALEHFGICVQNAVVADFGSHQGGFVDCLVQHGAARVYSIDTCYGTLAWSLRQNPKVVVYERTNAIHWVSPERLDLITIDVGWTRQRHIIPSALKNLHLKGTVLSLLKPQYEVAFENTTKGVLDDKEVDIIVQNALLWLHENFGKVSFAISPYRGSGGNREIWLYLKEVLKPPPGHAHQNSGFTLLEILVAMLVFLVGSTSIYALWIASIKIHRDALDEERVASLVESLVNDQYGRTDYQSVYGKTDKNFPGFVYDMVFTNIEQDAVLVTITITYPREGKEKKEIFHTVLLRSLPTRRFN